MEFLVYLIELWCLFWGLLTAGFLLIEIYDFFKGVFETIIRDYKIKHRFDKPPVAKCYCKDCIHFVEHTHDCNIRKRYEVSEDCFCDKAKPRKKVE